MLKLSND